MPHEAPGFQAFETWVLSAFSAPRDGMFIPDLLPFEVRRLVVRANSPRCIG